jgi:ATP-dependent exoDNAse (exonuclease V) alpha subunit
VKNGTLGTVERAEDGSLAVRLDSGEARQVQASQYAAVDHGYAVTITRPRASRSIGLPAGDPRHG